MKKLAVALLVAASAFAAPSFAQDGAVTLRVNSGTVMTSAGGEYQSANTGAQLATGQKVMVNAGSSATLVYGGGCTMTLNTPGVYDVPAACTRAAWNASGNNAMAAGVIIGVGVLAAALIASDDDVPVGPLSTGARHF